MKKLIATAALAFIAAGCTPVQTNVGAPGMEGQVIIDGNPYDSIEAYCRTISLFAPAFRQKILDEANEGHPIFNCEQFK